MYRQWIESFLPHPLTGPVEVTKDRPWSLVARVPTAGGVLWFKASKAGTSYEAGLTKALHEWAPGRVLEPVAVDADRGWSLLPDGGQTLRETGKSDWEAMLADHAQLQRDLAKHSDAMLALGVPDVRPQCLGPLGEELAAGPVPASVQHDDLHDANVFHDGKVFDWGDASVAHPFGVLLVSLRVAADKFDRRQLLRLRDAYLEPWSDLASPHELIRQVDLAIQSAKVNRSLAWQRALQTPELIREFGDPVQGWLDELNEPNVI